MLIKNINLEKKLISKILCFYMMILAAHLDLRTICITVQPDANFNVLIKNINLEKKLISKILCFYMMILAAPLDLRTICEELDTVKVKWSNIGVQLNIPYYKLQEFEEKKNPFAAVIDYWLNGNVKDVPITWKSIVTVLESRCVGERGLAQTILEKYCQSEPNISKGKYN